MGKRNVLEAVYNVLEKQIYAITGTLEKIMGVYVKLYYQIDSNSIYGDKDNVRSYPSLLTPDWEGRLLATGIYSERYLSDNTVDVYTSEEIFFYVKPDFSIPRHALALVGYFDAGTDTLDINALYPLKVHEDLVPYSLKNQLFKKIRLIPIEMDIHELLP